MTWAQQQERGSALLAGAAVGLARRGGWTVGRALTVPATAWFLLNSRRARAASREYLSRVLDRPATWRDVARHFDHFACAVLDRVMLLAGREREYDIRTEGVDEMLATVAQGRGCILLGAHLGSFEVLRVLAKTSPVPVWALMYRRNSGALTALLDQLAPGLRAHVLEIGDTASMIQARECVDRGEIVGVLADRSPPGHRLVPAPFLGATAQFPSGPFVLAATLGAPVFLFHGVRTGKRRYQVGMEKFADRVVLRRRERAADLRFYVHRYAEALERTCRLYPLEWFNFFPFWEADDARSGPAQPGETAASGLADPRPG
ncbi:MAG TPA: hypothetical protein VE650_00180 [Acetobacteraceae bacterium]|nr:hypothetical protein [Acetobacteraceae bacterium]